ncbi:hypothetical protein HUG15_02315 [Salicibibacter cibarius]|uniref:Tetratricopeptide repeat protein n=2 Tax=Salicibibacter TaxID=2685905 RepID=A0A514LJJ1_9BACI|nr:MULTISPECIES: hypothetical protein [Salicibibacter]QDI92017.1 hypothetical protein EPH95_13200 [Salicibibacter halophilus]QQK74551.1 hypothetical protein HUG15_02315 [Salicibibacter cibarius]
MQVLFTTPLEDEIPAFQSLSLTDAVQRTHDIDQRWKKQNKSPVALDFMVHDGEGQKLYTGTYHIGSSYAANLYEHMCYRLIERRMRGDEDRQQRDRLLHQLTQEAPAALHIDVNDHLRRQDEANQTWWSRLSLKARIMGSAAAGITLLVMVFAIGMVAVVSEQSNAIAAMHASYEEEQQMNELYAEAMAGDPDTAINVLQEKSYRSDQETAVLTHLLIGQGAYGEAMERTGQSAEAIANAIFDQQGIEALTDFQDDHETAIGHFELAYEDARYDDVVAVEDVPMNTERQEKLGYAYMKTGNVDEAKQIASEMSSESLNDHIQTYETLTADIEERKTQIDEEADADEPDDDQIDEWEDEIADMEAQRDDL